MADKQPDILPSSLNVLPSTLTRSDPVISTTLVRKISTSEGESKSFSEPIPMQGISWGAANSGHPHHRPVLHL